MEKNLARYRRMVTKINKLESEFETLKKSDFAAKTALLKMKLKKGNSLDSLLVEVFGLIREAARRTINLWAFSVQLQGAIAAYEGKIVEMKTGEGKTLAIIFVAFLRSLEGKGVHIVTANDYLAKRDAEWMGKVFALLGVSVGVVTSKTNGLERQISYSADITYITNNEVGFDFLKDNMILDSKNRCQRDLHFAIVDEADSVLIDGAQTPLVISDSQKTDESDKVIFQHLNKYIQELEEKLDYKVNQKERTVSLTIPGIKKLEKMLGVENLYSQNKLDYIYFVERLLKAHTLFERDKDYIVEDEKVVIVDEFTGRLMPQHRYFQGVHQAIETKENLPIQEESRTLASITFQHLFNKYRGMTGFTGTAKVSEKEFLMIYRKEVVQIPTNKKIIREDKKDRFFLSWEDKLAYLSWTMQEQYFKKRAVLVGTRSVEKSHKTHLSLLEKSIPSSVLNAKHTKREAEVISEAGQPQTVTVATNMAGRGTDISLDDDVRKNGGLIVVGMERHNAKRIDEQLIGRSGRQGDPGLTQFFNSADDDLFKNFFQDEYIKQLKKNLDYTEGVEDPVLQKIVDKAQKRIEGVFFDQRVLSYEFDKILEVHRNSFYRHRQRIINDKDLREETLGLIKAQLFMQVISKQETVNNSLDQKQLQEVVTRLNGIVGNKWFKLKIDKKKEYPVSLIRNLAYEGMESYYRDFEYYITSERARQTEKVVTLKVLDLLWIEHLKNVENIQESALINSIGRPDFFEKYKIQMTKAYRRMLIGAPKIICLTLFRTMNEMFEKEKSFNNIAAVR
ncbi:preprotein translocase subunit SecA [bacterium]|jgi:preprotein translocase subunit SecA|nr:preprotein translocase subunit SecA [bacterium]MBT4250991.1 preprotein translocase subunit SecA [bacterium]MBT4597777.1 preprotein translocase subunit SecA [bacterium]MBT6753872.1 preprotein translocase subunit SecA [bacterium]MBT7037416.1 preprotein translocase subunit SecA [bacterium]